MQTPNRHSLVLFTLLLIVCVKGSNGIGGWQKGSKTFEIEETNDADESTYKHNNVDGNMDKTYLDLFGESAKEFLTQYAPEKIKNVFPTTDKDCRWDWRYVRCEPYCECSLQPKLPGDFHLGRACRKRNKSYGSIENQSENDEIKSRLKKEYEMYQTYCVNEPMGEQSLSPPPASIPSPFPFLAKNSKASWKTLRKRTDPIVERVVDEFEMVHGKVQNVVCRDLKNRCMDFQSPKDTDNSSIDIDVAWQERLFCRDIVRECGVSLPRQEEMNNELNSEQ